MKEPNSEEFNEWLEAVQMARIDGFDAGYAHVTKAERKAHKVMTPEEYAAMPIIGWHEVCRDIDGFGGLGVRFLGTTTLSNGKS